MFANTPPMVESIVKGLGFQWRLPAQRYTAAAHALVSFYLSRNLLQGNDQFLRFKPSVSGGTNWEFSARIVQLATMLFDLRSDPAFGEICRRMSVRPLKQVHSELSAAARFKSHGFSILARPERSIMGEDFDFAVSAGSLLANVEVWETERANFDADALRRRLNDKKKQLPQEQPAAIVCVYPERWIDQVEEINSQFDAVAERFFSGSKRINCIMFAHEEFVDVGGAGMLLQLGYTVPCDNVRHPAPELIAALTGDPLGNSEVVEFVEAPKNAATVQRQHEFHRWVNWLLDGK